MSDKKDLFIKDDGAGPKISGVDYPSNSKKAREQAAEPVQEEKKKVSKVITGTVIKKKTPFFKKMAGVFLDENVDKVREYLITDVLIPAAKSTISDMVSSGVEMLLFGRVTGRSSARNVINGATTKINYGGFSSSQNQRRDLSYAAKSRHDFGEVVFPTRADAEIVLSFMTEAIDTYGQVTVGDFYDLVGITGSFADTKWGWTNLATSRVAPVREGFIIILPKTEVIE